MFEDFSSRAAAVTLRTYCRPKDDEGTSFESWPEVIQRSTYDHHLRLWEEAGGSPNLEELKELNQLGLERKGLLAGRTLWLGGTDYAYTKSSSQFNCSAVEISSVYDLVDAFWLLLNGCGVGAIPRVGILHGYLQPIPELEIVPSTKDKNYRGRKNNIEILPCASNDYTWTIDIGDDAGSWAKSLGKLVNSPRTKIRKLRLVFEEVRGPGGRLKGYGWICNGFRPLADAYIAIHRILNRKAGNLLDELDIGDIFNWCGSVLSSRRAAENLLLDSYSPMKESFTIRKENYWIDNPQRRQSNDSFLFWTKQTKKELTDLLYYALIRGDPGIVNASGMIRKAPWGRKLNPCFEIFLGAFCNLCDFSLPCFDGDFAALERAIWILARANYRQTCVNLNDGILQPTWHQSNEALRLCGISPTGVVQADYLTDYQIRRLRNIAVVGAYSMADELGMPRPKAITTMQPNGTKSKIRGRKRKEITEGMHLPLGELIFNWINFSVHDPLIEGFEAAGYNILPNPNDPANVLVCFPIEYPNTKFDLVNGKKVNLEPATKQLDRYLRWNNLWCDHNVSSTISFDESEIPEIVDWLDYNWDNGYIATAFLARNDPTKSAKELGHPYLPQDVVTEEVFREYDSKLRPINWSKYCHGIYDLNESGCQGGACPVR